MYQHPLEHYNQAQCIGVNMSSLQLKPNRVGRDFIIGDLHGAYGMFIDALHDIKFDKTIDRMFSVGDLVDRGEDSAKCLRLINEPWFYAVKGNHEEMMCDAYKDSLKYDSHQSMIRYDYTRNGGGWFYAEDKDSQFELKELAESMPLSITVGRDFGICHAQPPSNDWDDVKNINTHMELNMLWGRDVIRYRHPFDKVYNIGKTYHGHTYTKHVYGMNNMFFIDTGAVFGKYLTCLEINID